jgi:hypothetical protein
MKFLTTSAIVFFLFVAVACMTKRKAASSSSITKNIPIEIKLDTVKGFEYLIASQFGFASKYQKLIDSLRLAEVDTVGFFIRPCFAHRGLFFRIGHSHSEEYYFGFSASNSRVISIGDDFKVANDFFSFLCNAQLMEKNRYNDSVILIPDCPVILFVKLGGSFYYKKINGEELAYFSKSSHEFKRLLNKTLE